MAGKIENFAYSEPFVTKIGGLLFSQTKVECTAATGEYPKGGIIVKPEKLGMTDGLVAASWSTPLAEKKVLTKKEGGWKAYPTSILLYGEVDKAPVLFYSEPVLVAYQAGKEKEFELELTEAEGKGLAEYTCYIYAIGR